MQIKNLDVLQCKQCNAFILDDEANRKVSDAFRRRAGLLMPEPIQEQPELLRLTQKQLASILDIAESTLSRWETGAQIQQRCMDSYLRSFFDVPEARQYLMQRLGAAELIGILTGG